MKYLAFSTLAIALLLGLTHASTQQPPTDTPRITGTPDMPPMPTPQKEHELLQRFVGEWDFVTTVYIPGQPPMSAPGTETVRTVGEFWIIGESTGEMMGMPMTNVITIGYDTQRGRYVGTSVDSMSTHITQYEGGVNDVGDRFTLRWQSPCPFQDGAMVNFRGVTQFDGDDRRTFTAESQNEAGEWMRIVEVTFRRKG